MMNVIGIGSRADSHGGGGGGGTIEGGGGLLGLFELALFMADFVEAAQKALALLVDFGGGAGGRGGKDK